MRGEAMSDIADRLETFMPDGDGYNSEYANTLQEAVDALRAPTVMLDLLSGLGDALEDLELHGRHKDSGYDALKQWYSKMLIAAKDIDVRVKP